MNPTLDDVAVIARLHGLIRSAHSLVAGLYDEDEHDDSPGNLAFAHLSAALSICEEHASRPDVGFPVRRSPEGLLAYADGFTAATGKAVKQLRESADFLASLQETVMEVVDKDNEKRRQA